jgi:F-type H+-transporting ATPase subunit epsilon
MGELKVEIISTEGELYNGACKIAVIPAITGDIGIMSGHEAIISHLKTGDIIIYDNNENIIEKFAIESGFASTENQDHLIILVNK